MTRNHHLLGHAPRIHGPSTHVAAPTLVRRLRNKIGHGQGKHLVSPKRQGRGFPAPGCPPPGSGPSLSDVLFLGGPAPCGSKLPAASVAYCIAALVGLPGRGFTCRGDPLTLDPNRILMGHELWLNMHSSMRELRISWSCVPVSRMSTSQPWKLQVRAS